MVVSDIVTVTNGQHFVKLVLREDATAVFIEHRRSPRSRSARRRAAREKPDSREVALDGGASPGL